MKKLSVFLPWILPHLPGVTDAYAEQAVRDACIEFCEESEAVQTVDTFGVENGQPEYEVFTPPQQRLVRVLKVTYKNAELSPVAADMVSSGAALRAGVDTTVPSPSGTPSSFYQRTASDTAVYLWPVPGATESGVLAIKAAFAPVRSATQVEDVLFDQWIDGIVHGALYRLMSVPGQPFTNSLLSDYHRKMFETSKQRAARDAKQGATRGSLFVRPRAFA